MGLYERVVMELKKAKNVLSLIVVGLLDLREWGQSYVTSAERRGVIYNLVASFKAKKRWVMSGFEFHPPSLSPFIYPPLSIYLCLSVRVSFAFLWSDSAVEKFVFYSVFVFRSNQIEFSLFLYREGYGWAEKLLLTIFIFWTISSIFRYVLVLCAKAAFSILKKVSAPITLGECSRGRWLESLFCVCDKSEEIPFGPLSKLMSTVGGIQKRLLGTKCNCLPFLWFIAGASDNHVTVGHVTVWEASSTIFWPRRS